MRSLDRAISIEDLRKLARRRLPRIAFDFIDGAVHDELVSRKTTQRFLDYAIVPRILGGAHLRDQSTELFGRTYSSFFGIAPTGAIGTIRRDVELLLAEAAASAGIPQILSSVSNHSMETVMALAPGNVWSQLYTAHDLSVTRDLVMRAQDAGSPVLVWTVDYSASDRAERFARHNSSYPAKPTIAARLEALRHPAWIVEYLGGGMERLRNWEAYGSDMAERTQHFFKRPRDGQTWRDLEVLRKLWRGPLVLKGVLDPRDAVKAAELGADGVIVSNHGGNSFDRTPPAIDMLPQVVAAAGDKLTVMFDSGIRRGVDAVIARCLGAKFVFVGRAPLYGVAAGGKAGVVKAIDILKNDISTAMTVIGCTEASNLTADCVRIPERT